MYNTWFMEFAPSAYRQTRIEATAGVEATLHTTKNLTDVSVALLKANPGVLPTLRMSTCPPIAVDRLVGLASVSKNLVSAMEANRLPPRMVAASLEGDLERIGRIIEKMADPDFSSGSNAKTRRQRKLKYIVLQRLWLIASAEPSRIRSFVMPRRSVNWQ